MQPSHIKQIGYTIYSEWELAIRQWLAENLENLFGSEWTNHIPNGILNNATEALEAHSTQELEIPMELCEELNIPDYYEIVAFKNSYQSFIPDDKIPRQDFQDAIKTIYEQRNKIAHVKSNISLINIYKLCEAVEKFLPILSSQGRELGEIIEKIKKNPELPKPKTPPSSFWIDNTALYNWINNLPDGDYNSDGGYHGRADDIKAVIKLTASRQSVITISGAGGVGKTALAHKACAELLDSDKFDFDGLVWISAKEEELTVTGIEKIEPGFKNYEDIFDNILKTFGFEEEVSEPLDKKKEIVDTLLSTGKGILLVIDNLETIKDNSVLEFIKDIPAPSKIILTSRMGLGEVERRYPLDALKTKDAITLLRALAREKKALDLVKMPDEALKGYVEKMARYPLAIKWCVGQLARGKDINSVLENMDSASGDISSFCFGHIFKYCLNEDCKEILFILAAKGDSTTIGVLAHISNIEQFKLEEAIQLLVLSSLIIPRQINLNNVIETSYELLSLTRNYIFSFLKQDANKFEIITDKIHEISNLRESADKVKDSYVRYSLREYGASNEAETIASKLIRLAQIKYEASDDYSTSVSLFEQAKKIAPNFLSLYKTWAVIEFRAGNHIHGDELMKKATSLSPKDPSLFFTWGLANAKGRRFPQAKKLLNQSLSFSPKDGKILAALGDLERQVGNHGEAFKYLLKALDDKNNDIPLIKHQVICNTLLGDTLRRWAEKFKASKEYDIAEEKLVDANKYFQRAIELDPDDEKTFHLFYKLLRDRAFIKIKRGAITEACDLVDQSIIKNPVKFQDWDSNLYSYYFIASLLSGAGEIEKAKYYFDRSKKLLKNRNLRFYKRMKELAGEFGWIKPEELSSGTLSRFFTERGFGFIRDVSGKDVFFHIKNFNEKITTNEANQLVGQKLIYKLEEEVFNDGTKRYNASKVWKEAD